MIPQLTDNVEINQTLPVHPNAALGISAADMQRYLDMGSAIIKQYINEQLIPAIQELPASDIRATALTAESGENVAAQLAYLFSQLQNATVGTITDGSITENKLASGVRTMLNRDIEFKMYSSPGTYTYTVPHSGKYIVTLVGGGGGREGFKKNSDSDYYLALVSPPTAGGVAVKVMTLTKDQQYTLTVGSGGAGSAAPSSIGSNGASSGGTTSFGTVFSATGGNRSSGYQSQFGQTYLVNETVGYGIGGDINLYSGASRINGFRFHDISGYTSTVDNQILSYNIFSHGYADSTSASAALFPGGAPRGVCTASNSGVAGARGGNGAIFILYLG